MSTRFGAPGDIVAGPLSLKLKAGPIEVIRPDDLLVLKFSFVNLVIEPGEGLAQLVRAESENPAFIIVEFPPQSFIEELAPPNLTPPPPGSILWLAHTRSAGPSRLVFRLSTEVYPYSIEGLLRACGNEPLLVMESTTPAGPSAPEPTALEIPFGLIVSPRQGAAWAHSYVAVAPGARAELWHTRLAVRKLKPMFKDRKSGRVGCARPRITSRMLTK